MHINICTFVDVLFKNLNYLAKPSRAREAVSGEIITKVSG